MRQSTTSSSFRAFAIVTAANVSSCPMIGRSETKQNRYAFVENTAANNFTYEDIVSLVKNSKARSVDNLLPLLPKSFRANLTLVRDSRSLQQTDKLHPRAMMFTPDGRFVCTFGESPKLAGFDSLECYQYRKLTKSFDFREIKFANERDNDAEILFSATNMRADNSMSCTACHGVDPRPKWESYAFWPGLYGKHDNAIGGDDIVTDSEETNNRPNLRYGVALLDLLVERNARIIMSLGQETVAEFLQRSDKFSRWGSTADKVNVVLATKIPVFTWIPNFRTYDSECRIHQELSS